MGSSTYELGSIECNLSDYLRGQDKAEIEINIRNNNRQPGSNEQYTYRLNCNRQR